MNIITNYEHIRDQIRALGLSQLGGIAVPGSIFCSYCSRFCQMCVGLIELMALREFEPEGAQNARDC